MEKVLWLNYQCGCEINERRGASSTVLFSLSFSLSSAHICALWCPDPLTNLRIVGRPSLPLSPPVCVCLSPSDIKLKSRNWVHASCHLIPHTHLSMKHEIMADGPRCKRRKQANPRRKNGRNRSAGQCWDGSLAWSFPRRLGV